MINKVLIGAVAFSVTLIMSAATLPAETISTSTLTNNAAYTDENHVSINKEYVETTTAVSVAEVADDSETTEMVEESIPTSEEKTEVEETETETEVSELSTEVAETTTDAVSTSCKTETVSGVSITDAEYDYICHVVQGEAGAEPYDGQVLVAQCYLNAMKESGLDAYDVKSAYGYDAHTSCTPSSSVKKAVYAVFYEGYRYTDEPVLYFYAPAYCQSPWHESQIFVCQVGGHRFFARRGS